MVGSYTPISTTYGDDGNTINNGEVIADWYVDSVHWGPDFGGPNTSTDYLIASDDNDGKTPHTPFASLAKAKSVVQDGQKIALRRGDCGGKGISIELGRRMLRSVRMGRSKANYHRVYSG